MDDDGTPRHTARDAKAHVKADALLSELATLLASRIDVETQQKTQQIIQTYDKIKKWYA